MSLQGPEKSPDSETGRDVEGILSTWKSEKRSNSNRYCTLSIMCLFPLQLPNRWTGEETEAPGSRDLLKATQVVNMGTRFQAQPV